MGAYQTYLEFQKQAADDVVELPYAVAHPYEYAQRNKEKRFYEGLQYGAMYGALTGAAIGAQRPSVGRFMISVPASAGIGAALLSYALPRIEEAINWAERDGLARQYEKAHGPLPSAIRYPKPFTPVQQAHFANIVDDYQQQLQKQASLGRALGQVALGAGTGAVTGAMTGDKNQSLGRRALKGALAGGVVAGGTHAIHPNTSLMSGISGAIGGTVPGAFAG